MVSDVWYNHLCKNYRLVLILVVMEDGLGLEERPIISATQAMS